MSTQGAETKLPSREEMIEGIHYYINEQGYWVFTAFYHQLRGYCCGNGCKHCPYPKQPNNP